MANVTRAMWRKSSYSSGNGGNCVEVCTSEPGVVAVRDSKNVPGPELVISDQAWAQLIEGVKHGAFDL
jgi:Domain of unknown function (DUF397)